MLHLSPTINLLELVWVVIAVAGLTYSLKLRHDAKLDVKARHLDGTNSGKEDLAKMLIVTASLNAFGFLAFLLAGGGAMLIPSSRATTPRSYAIQLLLIAAQIAMAASVWHKQRVRTKVFIRDRENEILRLAAVASVAADHLDQNTQALAELTDATRENTDVLRTGDG